MTIFSKKHRIHIRSFVVLLLVTLAPWASKGLIVCYGEDGHVGVARESEKKCCKASEAPEYVSPSAQLECSPCVDVPVQPGAYLSSANKTASFHDQTLYANSYFNFVPSREYPSRGLLYSGIKAPDSKLCESLKTVILLI